MRALLSVFRGLLVAVTLYLGLMAFSLIVHPEIMHELGNYRTLIQVSSLVTPCFDMSWDRHIDGSINMSFNEEPVSAKGTGNACESKTKTPQLAVTLFDHTVYRYDRAFFWTFITSRAAFALLSLSTLALTCVVSVRKAIIASLLALGSAGAWIAVGMPPLSIQQLPFAELTSVGKVALGALVVPPLYWLCAPRWRTALLCGLSVFYLYLHDVSFEYLMLLGILIAMTWAVLPHPLVKKPPLSPFMGRIITLMLTAFSIGLAIMIPVPRARPPYEMILLITLLCGGIAGLLFWTDRALRHAASQHLSIVPVMGAALAGVLLFLPDRMTTQLAESVSWTLFLTAAMALCLVLCSLLRYRASQAHRRFVSSSAILILIVIFVTFKWPAYPDPFVVLGFSYIAFRLLHVLLELRLARDVPAGSFSEWSLYALFFPALTVGPIDRWPRFITDLRTEKAFSWVYISAGWQRLLWGSVKKFIVANILLSYTSIGQMPLDYLTPLYAWVQLYVYAFYLYCDFSGFVDIAIGTAQLLGFQLPENFDRPYTRGSIAQFWQSWHMTLSNWLRTYIFLPLSRMLLRTRLKRFPLLIVLIANVVTMGLIGLWHGLTLNFLVWGLWHAMGLFVHKIFSDRTRRTQMKWKGTWKAHAFHVFSVALTFHFVVFGWVFFALPSFEESLRYLALMVGARL